MKEDRRKPIRSPAVPRILVVDPAAKTAGHRRADIKPYRLHVLARFIIHARQRPPAETRVSFLTKA